MKESHSKSSAQRGDTKVQSFFQRKMEGQFFSNRAPVQTKLRVGKPNDKYEREADHVADRVVDKGEMLQPKTQSITPLVRTSEIAQNRQDPYQTMQEEAMKMEEEAPAQAKSEEGKVMKPEAPLQKQGNVQEMEEVPAQAKAEEGKVMKKEAPLQKQEDVQEMEEEPAQAKSEEGKVMKKEAPLQKQEDDVQEMEEEPAQAKSEEGKVMKKEAPLQKQEDVQEMEEESAQAKSEEGKVMQKEAPLQKQEDDVQEMEEEPAQAKAEEGKVMKKEAPLQKQEDVQEMEEEPAQDKAEEGNAMKKEAPLQKQEDVQEMEKEPAQAKAEEGKVMQKEAPLQKQEDDVQEMEEEPAQAKEEEGNAQAKEEEALQGKGLLNNVSIGMEKLLKDSKGKGSHLPEGVRNQMEASFGADFSEVRIHTGADAAAMSKNLGALAFAHEGDIYFNVGKFDVNSKKGQQLLAHELTHTIQQGAVEIETTEETTQAEAHQLPTSTEAGNVAAVPITPKTAQKPAPKTEKHEDVSDTDIPEGQEPVASSDAAAPMEGESMAVPRSPEEDPNFQALKERAESTAEGQTKHTPAAALSKNAGDAAPSPDNERMSEAQEKQVDEMDEAEPKLFDAAMFKKMLLEQIAKILPQNEEDAGNFKKDKRMDQVTQAATSKVKEEKANAAGGIETATTTPPDPESVPERTTVDLKTPEAGKKPGSLEASQAMPPERPDSEVKAPLEENAKEVDDEMAQNGVTEEQLAKSEEPTFISALDSKKTAQEHSNTAPADFRGKETSVLDNTRQQSDTFSEKQVEAMHGDRMGLFGKVANVQKDTSKTNTSERDKIARDIDDIFQKTKTDVENNLSSLDTGVQQRFDAANGYAKLRFENYVEQKMDAYKENRYGSWYNPVGLARRAGDYLFDMPAEVNQFFVEGRQLYMDEMDKALTSISEYIATELAAAVKRIEQGKAEVKRYVKALPANLKKYGEEAASEMEDKFAQLNDSVISKQDELIDTLANSYKAGLEEVDARIEEMKAANRGLVNKALDAVKGVIETIKKLKEMVENLLSAIKSVIGVIIADPIGFMKNLFAGIGQGIDNFKANIEKHLLGGLFQWLTGSLGPMGITIPENLFSLSGIFNLVMQILGLGWDFIRQKAVKMFGEPAVAALEKGFAMFQLFREKGIEGIWEYLKEQFNDLKETVLGAIQNMIITQVIQAGIKWLLSLLIPGAGFIKAIMAIKDLIVFFVESAMMLIPAVTEAILALAAGSVAMVAKAIEKGLGLLIPLVINLLAKLIGISGLAQKVQKIIKNIRKRIDKQVSKLLMKAKNWVKKVFKKGKAKAKKMAGKLVQWWKTKKKFKNKGGENHTLFFKGKNKNAKLYIASNKPLDVLTYINGLKGKAGVDQTSLTQAESGVKRRVYVITGSMTSSGKQEETQKLEQLEKALTETSNALSLLAGNPKKPKPKIKYGNKRPSIIEALFLNKEELKPREGETPNPETSRTVGFKLIYNAGLTKVSDRWTQMHIINAKFGGVGEPKNLIPGPTSVNTGAKQTRFDDGAVAPLLKESSNVVWIKGDVKYRSGKTKLKNGNSVHANQFPLKLILTAGLHVPEGNNWEKMTGAKVKADIPIPNPDLGGIAVKTINEMTGTEMRNTGLTIFMGNKGDSLINFIKRTRTTKPLTNSNIATELLSFASKHQSLIATSDISIIVNDLKINNLIK